MEADAQASVKTAVAAMEQADAVPLQPGLRTGSMKVNPYMTLTRSGGGSRHVQIDSWVCGWSQLASQGGLTAHRLRRRSIRTRR